MARFEMVMAGGVLACIFLLVGMSACMPGQSPWRDAHSALYGETVCIREVSADRINIAWVQITEAGSCVEYDPEALRAVTARYGYSASVGVMAHELGHMLCIADHGDMGQPCADSWAGCALARRGYEPFEYLSLIQDNDPSPQREAATWRGWYRCSAI